MQTQTSNTLHNAIMEAGSKDRPPMLAPEWQRFVTLVKQSQELKTVLYHKLYDILKQHQHEVNEIRAEKIACVANPLALVAQQQPVYHPQNPHTHYTQNSSTKSQQAVTRNRGKAIVNSSQPIYDQEPSMVAEDNETSKDKKIDKLMALISLSFKKIYKPTNNNLRTSSTTSRANQDNSPRINKNAGYENQRIGNVAGARETVARECQKPKRAKDAAYHKEKMLLCKQEEAGIQLNVEQANWRDDTDDDELEDQELEAHYMYMAQLQEVSPDAADSGPIFDDEPLQKLIEIVLFIVDFGCSKNMTGNLKLLINFVEKFLGTGNDLLIGSHGSDLYSISLQDTNCPNLICLMAKASSSQAWLWHRHLSHLNFDTINLLSKNDIVVGLPMLKFVKDHLCSSYEFGKAKRKSFHTKITPSSKRRLQLLHMNLCGPMRVASINGKRYVLVIVDDYSRYTWTHFLRYTWTHFLRSKDETPEVLIDFLRLVQRGLQAQVRVVRTDKGTKFLNQTLHAYFAAEGILHQTSVARTPEQNGVVERRNRTLVEAARTMLSEKGDECIFVGYSTQSRAYRVFNKRTRVIMESIHVNFDELPQMASDQLSSDPAPEYRTRTTSNELDLLLSPMFDELINGSSKVVSKPSVVSATDAPNHRQHNTTPLNIHTTPAPTCQALPLAPTVISSENINQAEMYAENDQVVDDEFINIFSTPVQDQGETSTRCQLESDAEMCMIALTVSRTEPKNIKETMADSA
nr:hypothetical protein [Tanacetum cinerariifolium]